jgi:hypothetical protein
MNVWVNYIANIPVIKIPVQGDCIIKYQVREIYLNNAHTAFRESIAARDLLTPQIFLNNT